MTDEPGESNPPYNFPTTLEGFADVTERCFANSTWKEREERCRSLGLSAEEVFSRKVNAAEVGAIILGLDLEEAIKKL